MSCMPAPIKAQGARPLQISLESHAGKSLQTPDTKGGSGQGSWSEACSPLLAPCSPDAPKPEPKPFCRTGDDGAQLPVPPIISRLHGEGVRPPETDTRGAGSSGARERLPQGSSPRGKTDVPYLTPARHQTTDVLIMYRVPHWTREMPTIDRSTANPFDGPSYLPCDDACQRKICVS